MRELSSESRFLVTWIAWQGPLTVEEITNETGVSLLTVLGVLPELVESGWKCWRKSLRETCKHFLGIRECSRG